MLNVSLKDTENGIDNRDEDKIGYPIDKGKEHMLGTILLSKDENEDIWPWKDDISREVSIRLTYEILMEEKYGRSQREDVEWLWNVLVYPKIQFFLWKCVQGYLLTMDLLILRGMNADTL